MHIEAANKADKPWAIRPAPVVPTPVAEDTGRPEPEPEDDVLRDQ
jgi:hypothetical protein